VSDGAARRARQASSSPQSTSGGGNQTTRWSPDRRVVAGSPAVSIAHERASRVTRLSGRASALIEALRQRFPDYPHSPAFDAWNAQQSQGDRRRFLTTRLFSDINRGHTPTPHHVSALAAAIGWTFEQVSLALGVDFARIPHLHLAMSIDRTHVDETRIAFGTTLRVPSDLAPIVRPDLNAPLNELVVDWTSAAAREWTSDDRYLTGHIGREDNLAYPRLPSGVAVLIDRTRVRPAAEPDAYYAVEHPMGTSCSRIVMERGRITLLSERRDLFPALDFSATQVRVIGRIVAFAGRIDRMTPPAGFRLSRVIEERRPMLDQVTCRELPIQSLLRELAARHGFTRSRFERKVHILQRLAGKPFKVSRTHMLGMIENTQLAPRLNTLFALSAMLLLDPLELLRAYGVPVGAQIRSGAAPGGGEPPVGSIGRIRTHPTIVQLERAGWNFSWLSSLPQPHGRSQRMYYLGDPGPHLAPLVTAQVFLVVNRRQRHVLSELLGRSVTELGDWTRPIYLLQTQGQRRYLAGYVEHRGATLDVIPHPDAPTRRVLRFRHPEEAVVVGRVTHVATLIE
jgi:hypothetical protein